MLVDISLGYQDGHSKYCLLKRDKAKKGAHCNFTDVRNFEGRFNKDVRKG